MSHVEREQGLFGETDDLAEVIDRAADDPVVVHAFVEQIRSKDPILDVDEILDIRNRLAKTVRDMRGVRGEDDPGFVLGVTLLEQASDNLVSAAVDIKAKLDDPPDSWTPGLISALAELREGDRTVSELAEMGDQKRESLEASFSALLEDGVLVETGPRGSDADMGYELTPIGRRALPLMAEVVVERETGRFDQPRAA